MGNLYNVSVQYNRWRQTQHRIFGYRDRLAFRSGFIPRIIGILLLVNGGAYLVDTTIYFLALDVYKTVNTVLLLPLCAGEFATIFWLLFRGFREPEALSSQREITEK
ncbi:MAG: DUF4386 domain-containing protein [Chitinispirillaceae bacterium]|nr:DUF4386 domain-containing protein [Chitinispirillaceae bacterium]